MCPTRAWHSAATALAPPTYTSAARSRRLAWGWSATPAPAPGRASRWPTWCRNAGPRGWASPQLQGTGRTARAASTSSVLVRQATQPRQCERGDTQGSKQRRGGVRQIRAPALSPASRHRESLQLRACVGIYFRMELVMNFADRARPRPDLDTRASLCVAWPRSSARAVARVKFTVCDTLAAVVARSECRAAVHSAAVTPALRR